VRRNPFSYAILRAVPNLVRGEALNVGVIVYCRPLQFLGARTELDEARLRAICPTADCDELRPLLRAIERIAAGDPDAGPIAAGDLDARFHWLVAPSSTIVQPSEVHTGVCDDPSDELERLFRELVVAP
jgi:Protein of unknown function (DUF3037)